MIHPNGPRVSVHIAGLRTSVRSDGRPASWFRDECLKRGVAVGRDFPPLAETHARISLGTMEEMGYAVAGRVLAVGRVSAFQSAAESGILSGRSTDDPFLPRG